MDLESLLISGSILFVLLSLGFVGALASPRTREPALELLRWVAVAGWILGAGIVVFLLLLRRFPSRARMPSEAEPGEPSVIRRTPNEELTREEIRLDTQRDREDASTAGLRGDLPALREQEDRLRADAGLPPLP